MGFSISAFLVQCVASTMLVKTRAGKEFDRLSKGDGKTGMKILTSPCQFVRIFLNDKVKVYPDILS